MGLCELHGTAPGGTDGAWGILWTRWGGKAVDLLAVVADAGVVAWGSVSAGGQEESQGVW